MNNLQWVLVVLGVLVVVGIYLYSRKLGSGGDDPGENPADPWAELLNDDPGTTAEPGAASNEPAEDWQGEPPDREPAPAAESEAVEEQPVEAVEKAPIRMHTPPPGEEKLVVLHVAFQDWLEGGRIHAALEACELRYGPRRIYHRVEPAEGCVESVFCVANMLKPGYLDPAEAGDFNTRGLSLFLVLPGPVGGVQAYRNMLETARQLADRLDGRVLDQKKIPLNQQMEQYLHEDVVTFEHRRAVRG